MPFDEKRDGYLVSLAMTWIAQRDYEQAMYEMDRQTLFEGELLELVHTYQEEDPNDIYLQAVRPDDDKPVGSESPKTLLCMWNYVVDPQEGK